MRKIYVTVDTEADADIHWVKNEPLQYTSVVEGIPKYLRPIWDKYNINPVYFVSYEVLQNEKCCDVLKDEISKGAIIGAHLHPEYLRIDKLSNKEKKYPFPCFECSKEEEQMKILELTNEIREKLGIIPTWYRAARFGADIDTINILKKLGYKVDSSVTPGIDWGSKGGPNHSLGTCGEYCVDENDLYKKAAYCDSAFKELPITITGKRFGIMGKILSDNWLFYKWLRPTHMFLFEQKQIIREMQKKNIELVMMFHSMEIMIKKSPYVRNKFMQKYYLYRLDKTIEYAIKKGYKTG